MENEELSDAGLSATPDDVIIKEGRVDEHVYEQQISRVSSTAAETDTRGEFEPGIEQPVSVGNTDPNKLSTDPKEAADIQPAVTTVKEDTKSSAEDVTKSTDDTEDITEINFEVDRDDGHESPQSIRRHQLEDLVSKQNMYRIVDS